MSTTTTRAQDAIVRARKALEKAAGLAEQEPTEGNGAALMDALDAASEAVRNARVTATQTWRQAVEERVKDTTYDIDDEEAMNATVTPEQVSAVHLRNGAWSVLRKAAYNGGEVPPGWAGGFTTECVNRGVLARQDTGNPVMTDLGWAVARYMQWVR